MTPLTPDEIALLRTQLQRPWVDHRLYRTLMLRALDELEAIQEWRSVLERGMVRATDIIVGLTE